MVAKSKDMKAKTRAKTQAPQPSGRQSETSARTSASGDTQSKDAQSTGTAIVERRGGYRPGSGRKIGSRPGQNIHTLKNEVIRMREKYKKLPLDHLMRALNEECSPKMEKETDVKFLIRKARWYARQDWAAVQAAPYMHAKLASIEVIDSGAPVKHDVDLKKLSAEQLDQLEALVRQASVNPEDANEIQLDESEYHEVSGNDNDG